MTFLQWATAVLYNGLGRCANVLAAANLTGEDPQERLFSTWPAVDLIEAATRSGRPEQAAGALQRLSDSTRASGSDWALGIEACARTLLSDGESAERLYREAIAMSSGLATYGASLRRYMVWSSLIRLWIPTTRPSRTPAGASGMNRVPQCSPISTGGSARSDGTHLRSTPGLTIERDVGVSMPRAPRQRRAA
jgi:hypothetical protein